MSEVWFVVLCGILTLIGLIALFLLITQSRLKETLDDEALFKLQERKRNR